MTENEYEVWSKKIKQADEIQSEITRWTNIKQECILQLGNIHHHTSRATYYAVVSYSSCISSLASAQIIGIEEKSVIAFLMSHAENKITALETKLEEL